MTNQPPAFDPNTCLHQCHGYELYRHAEKPWVVHRFSKRKKGGNGLFVTEQLVEHLELDGNAWGDTATAQEARKELQQAWIDLVEWNAAMKGL